MNFDCQLEWAISWNIPILNGYARVSVFVLDSYESWSVEWKENNPHIPHCLLRLCEFGASDVVTAISTTLSTKSPQLHRSALLTQPEKRKRKKRKGKKIVEWCQSNTTERWLIRFDSIPVGRDGWMLHWFMSPIVIRSSFTVTSIPA